MLVNPGQQGECSITWTGPGAELDALGTRPSPVGAGLAPNDGSIGIRTEPIASWLVPQVTTAHTEVITRIDWEIGVVGEPLVPIGAIRIVTIRNRCVNERQCYQPLQPLFDSRGRGRHGHVNSDRVTGFEGPRCECTIAEEPGGQNHSAIPISNIVECGTCLVRRIGLFSFTFIPFLFPTCTELDWKSPSHYSTPGSCILTLPYSPIAHSVYSNTLLACHLLEYHNQKFLAVRLTANQVDHSVKRTIKTALQNLEFPSRDIELQPPSLITALSFSPPLWS